MNKAEKIAVFDPNGVAEHNTLFGLPFTAEESETWVLPVPWEVTVSYGTGTAKAPEAILEASHQVDLYHPLFPDAWQKGIYMYEVSQELFAKSEKYRAVAERILEGSETKEAQNHALAEVNGACAGMVEWVKQSAVQALKNNKKLILLGGDHSTPLGYIQALAEQHSDFGILQIDAHADLRDAYEGFTYSHASIMFNALKIKAVSQLVQVGIRDYAHSEQALIAENNGRVSTFFDRDLKSQQFEGISWQRQCMNIVNQLPQKVYVSFDIDGLDPKLCPHTGTPVAGGFEEAEVLYLLEMVVRSGREFIGMDLNEVGVSDSTDWDANVAARILYKLHVLLHL